MSIALDVIIILIAATTLIVTLKKGFIRTILDFASFICALILSKMFAPTVSQWFYDALYRNVSGKVKEIIGNMLENGNLPESFEQDNIKAFLVKYNAELADKIGEEAIDNTVQIITQNLVGLLAYALAFILIFVITIISFKVLSVVLGGVFRLPVLKTLDKTLAFVLGVILAGVYVMLFIAIMQIMIPPLSSVVPEYINSDIIENTMVFNYLYSFKWIEIFVN